MYYSFGILENSKKAKNINRNTYLSDFINTYLSNKYIVTTMTKKIEIRTEKFNVLESKDNENEVTIKGTAVPYNKRSRNGAKYTGKSIKKAAKTLEGKSLLYNHDENQVLGKVEETIPREDRLDFIAKANTEKEKVQDIHNGYVNTVSIQAMVEENEDAEEKEVLDVKEFLELSATPVPGFGDASITKHNNETNEEVRVETFDSLTENKEDTSGEPFAGFKDWNDCHSTMKDKGYTDEEADKICGALQDEFEDIKNQLNKNGGENMTDEDKNEEQDIEDLEDALNWIESNAPDKVISMIQDALQTEEADDDEDDEDNEEDEASEEGDKDKPEEKETEEEEEEEDTNEDNEDTEEKLQKLTERIEKLEKQESKEVEKSKQPNVGSEKPTDASTLAEKIRKAAKGGD